MVTASNRIMARIITNPDVKMKGIMVLLSKSVLASGRIRLAQLFELLLSTRHIRIN